jgi:hypothetical protein
MGESERNMVVNFLWVWWDTRNKLNAGEHARPLAEVLYKTMEMASSADQLNLGKKNVPGVIRMEKKKWLPPPVDVLKINSDRAFIAIEKCGAWGFVIRDSAGQGVLAGSGRLPAVHDAVAAEGEACLAALYAAMAIKNHC